MQTLASNEQSNTASNVSITEPALAFIKRMVRMSGIPQAGFRLVVSPGGCSGLSSEFTVDKAPGALDEVLVVGDVKLFVPKVCRPLLDGVTIDFADSPTKTGFVFVDPKAGSCDCSTGNTKIQLGMLS